MTTLRHTIAFALFCVAFVLSIPGMILLGLAAWVEPKCELR